MFHPQYDSQTYHNDHRSELERLPLVSSTEITTIESNGRPDYAINEDENTLHDEQEQEVLNQPLDYWHGETGGHRHWSVYLGDAKTVLSRLPDNTFHCVITSPPYYWLRDYGVEGQIGKEWKIEDYVQAIADVMDQVKRVLTSDGVLFLNIGDTYYSGKGQSQGTDKKSKKRRFGLRAVDASGLGIPQKSLIGIPWRVAIELIDRGWVLRSSIIWDRLHTLPESVKDRPGHTYEYIFMLVRSKKYYFNQQALNGQKEDIWTIKARPKPTPGISTAPFPDELVQKCIDVGCPKGGHVLDPFAGSGTTLRVALQADRDVTGIDISLDFCKYTATSLMWI